VAIVNEAFTRKFFGGANPIGHTFHQAADAGRPEPAFQIVGLVANTKYGELREDFRPIAYFPLAQDEHPGTQATFVLRIAGSPGQVINRAKAEVHGMSSAIGIEFVPLSAQLRDSLLREKLMATLSGSFGLLAGVVAILGLYGVIAYMVARRRNEFGVRMAMGATRSDVVRLVLREAVCLVAVGLALGGVLALSAGKAAGSLLFGVGPSDGLSLTVAGVVLATVALIASYVPARRAAGSDPLAALRHE
jgi:putative ABC transport system permease protein